MSINKSILKVLNIEQRELLPVALLVLYSFFMGASVAIFYTASTSIFLVNFDRTMVPVAYVASGILVFLLSRVFAVVQKNLTLSRLSIVAISFLLLSVVTLSIGYFTTKNVWICFMLFIWIRAFVFVNGITFWVTASKIFNLQQAKRLFSFIGTGDVVAAIISYISIPFLLKWMIVDELYFIAIITLSACAIIMFIIGRKFSGELSVAVIPASKKVEAEQPERSFVKNKYHLWIFIMAMMGVFGLYFVEFMFFVQSRIEFPDKNLLAGFLGLFFGLCAIIEFIFKTAVYRRLLNRFGIKLGLIILPISLTFSYALAFGYGMFYGVGGMFFSFVVLSRFFISSVRKSISDPSFQLLFQIIPSAKRVALQSKVEGIPKALGSIVSGIILFALLKFSSISMVYLALFALLFALLWIRLTILTYREYRGELRSSLVKSPVQVNEYSTTSAMIGFYKQQLINSDTASFPRVFALLKNTEPALITPVLIDVLAYAPVGVKLQVLDIFQDYKILNIKNHLTEYLDVERDVDLVKGMLALRRKINQMKGVQIEEMVALSQSTDYNNRVMAARLLGQSRRYNAYIYIVALLQDAHPDVRKAAIIAAGNNRRAETWPYLFDSLEDVIYRNTAASAIVTIGEPVLKELELFFLKLIDQLEVSLVVLKIIRRIGGVQAIRFLRSKMNHSNRLVRDEVLIALNKFEYKATHTEYTIIKNSIEDEVRFMVWNTAARTDLYNTNSEILVSALKKEYEWQKNRIFDLLSVIYDNQRINIIQENLTKSVSEARVLALEVIDMTLSDELKALIVPLLDGTSGRELLRVYALNYAQQELSVADRCLDIIQKDFSRVSPWTKANALFRLESFNRADTKLILEALVCHPNPMIGQSALLGVQNISKEWYQELSLKFKLNDPLSAINDGVDLPVYEKVLILSKVELFSSISQTDLLRLATSAKLIFLKKDTFLDPSTEVSWCEVMFVVATGAILSAMNDREVAIGPHGFIPDINRAHGVVYKAEQNSVLFALNGDLLYSVFADNMKLTEKYIDQVSSINF